MPAVPSPPLLERLITSPLAGGAAAVIGAVIAFLGIGRTVKKAGEANAETKRKNTDEQWWKTLEWAYAEAKSLKDDQNPAPMLAIVGILRALKDHEPLSPLQEKTVDQVTEIFSSSSNPVVRDQSDNVRQTPAGSGGETIHGSNSKKRTAASELTIDARQYEEALAKELEDMPAHLKADLYCAYGGVGPDFVLETANGRLLLIEAQIRRLPLGTSDLAKVYGLASNDIWRQVTAGFGQDSKFGAWADRELSGMIVVTNQPEMREDARNFLDRHKRTFAVVDWMPGSNSLQLRNAIAAMDGSSSLETSTLGDK
jgi:hypothetical protein